MKHNVALYRGTMAWLGHEQLLEEGSEDEANLVLNQASAFLVPCMWRAGVLQTFLDPDTIESSAAIHAVHRLHGNVRQTFKQLDVDGDGSISVDELRGLLEMIGIERVEPAMVAALARKLDKNDNGKIDFHEFSQWYLASEERMKAELHEKFAELDTNRDGTICVPEFTQLLQKLRVKARRGPRRPAAPRLTPTPRPPPDPTRPLSPGGRGERRDRYGEDSRAGRGDGAARRYRDRIEPRLLRRTTGRATRRARRRRRNPRAALSRAASPPPPPSQGKPRTGSRGRNSPSGTRSRSSGSGSASAPRRRRRCTLAFNSAAARRVVHRCSQVLPGAMPRRPLRLHPTPHPTPAPPPTPRLRSRVRARRCCRSPPSSTSLCPTCGSRARASGTPPPSSAPCCGSASSLTLWYGRRRRSARTQRVSQRGASD